MKNLERSIVTGTGRSGTTLFIQLLGELGFTTLPKYYNASRRAGFEFTVKDDITFERLRQSPKVFKCPRLIVNLKHVLEENKNFKIKRAFLCVREYEKSALSKADKRLVWISNSRRAGFEHRIETGNEIDDQIIFFQRAIGQFIETVSIHEIPLTILHFPRFTDPQYLHDKLKGTEFECDLSKISQTIDRIVRKEYIHEWKRN